MRARGFTIVELIITITIMGILLVLTVVNVGSTQMKARDEERVADVETIGSALENFYSTGNDNTAAGTYPSTATSGGTNEVILTNLRDRIPITAILAPGITDEAYKTFISATDPTQTTAGVLPQPDKDHYVYQPLQASGAICTSASQGCRKYNIYYYLESDGTVYKYESKNR